MSKLWYAVQSEEYTDWDWGSHDFDEAVSLAKGAVFDGYDGVKIAVINEDMNYCEMEYIVNATWVGYNEPYPIIEITERK